MRVAPTFAFACGLAAVLSVSAAAQATTGAAALRGDTLADPVRELASRLDLARYKATIKGLTQFGDRRQGTDRNANAVTWIETQLRSYGCTGIERVTFVLRPGAIDAFRRRLATI